MKLRFSENRLTSLFKHWLQQEQPFGYSPKSTEITKVASRSLEKPRTRKNISCGLKLCQDISISCLSEALQTKMNRLLSKKQTTHQTEGEEGKTLVCQKSSGMSLKNPGSKFCGLSYIQTVINQNWRQLCSFRNKASSTE